MHLPQLPASEGGGVQGGNAPTPQPALPPRRWVCIFSTPQLKLGWDHPRPDHFLALCLQEGQAAPAHGCPAWRGKHPDGGSHPLLPPTPLWEAEGWGRAGAGLSCVRERKALSQWVLPPTPPNAGQTSALWRWMAEEGVGLSQSQSGQRCRGQVRSSWVGASPPHPPDPS